LKLLFVSVTSVSYMTGRFNSIYRAGLNEREAPRHLGQLRSVSHALFSTVQKHRSKTSKLIRFGSLHFRDNWGWPCTQCRIYL